MALSITDTELARLAKRKRPIAWSGVTGSLSGVLQAVGADGSVVSLYTDRRVPARQLTAARKKSILAALDQVISEHRPAASKVPVQDRGFALEL